MACDICNQHIWINQGTASVHTACLDAIRADERAKVEAEVVAYLRQTPRASGQLISIESSNDIARLAQDIERGEHRQKAGT